MDKIWNRNPLKSEVTGRCGGDEKTQMITQNRQKSNTKKTQKQQQQLCFNLWHILTSKTLAKYTISVHVICKAFVHCCPLDINHLYIIYYTLVRVYFLAIYIVFLFDVRYFRCASTIL